MDGDTDITKQKAQQIQGNKKTEKKLSISKVDDRVGAFIKEQEPLSKDVTIEEVNKEPEVSSELREIGIKQREEKIELAPDVRKLGVHASSPPSQISLEKQSSLSSKTNLPLTDEQIVKGLHVKLTNSLRWLALWCLRQLRRTQTTLKEIHGRVIRVEA